MSEILLTEGGRFGGSERFSRYQESPASDDATPAETKNKNSIPIHYVGSTEMPSRGSDLEPRVDLFHQLFRAPKSSKSQGSAFRSSNLETASFLHEPWEIQAMHLQGIHFTGEYFQSNSNPGSLDGNEVPAVDPGWSNDPSRILNYQPASHLSSDQNPG